MGSMISRIAAIDNLNFRPFPTRGLAGRLARRGRIVVAVSAKGKLYTNCETLSENCACVPAEWPWLDDILGCLKELGIIDDAAVRQHRDICTLREQCRDAEHDLEYLPKQLAKYGVTLTAEQLRHIAAATTNGLHKDL
jgi:hypothetical protein